jgi:glycosyltransferase involved in cell wall biosynthesis
MKAGRAGAARRLTLVIDGLGPGGAENVLTLLANAWAERGDGVTLVTFAGQDEPPFRPLATAVRRLGLGLRADSHSLAQAVAGNVRRVRGLREAMRSSRPDAVISFCDRVNVLTLLAASGLGIPVIVSERVDPARHAIGFVWDALRRLTYPRARAVVVQSTRFVAAIPPAARARTVVIPNPVVHAAGAGVRSDTPARLVAMGRLDRQKGFDVLIRAFAAIAARHPRLRLVIFGEGPARADLQKQIDDLGLADRVELPGVVPGPAAALRDADIFVLPSRYEGFPNALCEAMACGIPVVASDTGAVSEIVRDGENGLVVPTEDSAAVAAALERLVSDKALRARLAAQAPGVTERYSLANVRRTWDDAILSAIAAGGTFTRNDGPVPGLKEGAS